MIAAMIDNLADNLEFLLADLTISDFELCISIIPPSIPHGQAPLAMHYRRSCVG